MHILPYKDTFEFNFDHMYQNHIVPYLKSKHGVPFRTGMDFTHGGARFRIVACEPAEGCVNIAVRSTQGAGEGGRRSGVCRTR